jgi:MFS family permease
MPFMFLFFGLPVISRELGASALEIGGLFSVFTATTLLLRPLVGWLADRFGPKGFFVMALFIYAVAMAAFAVAGSLTWLYFGRIIQGIGSAFLWTAANAIVAGLTNAGERGRAMGRLSEITARGGLVGIFAALAAVAAFPHPIGWKVVFTGFALFTVVGAMLAWKTVPNIHPPPEAQPAVSTVTAQLLRLLIIVLITGAQEAMLSPIYLTYLQDKFTANMEILAWAFFPAGLVTAAISARLGGLSDRFGRAPMMALGLAGAGAVSLALPHLSSLALLAALYTTISIMWGVSDPAESALVADLTGNRRRGLGYGLYDFAKNMGFTLGPLLGGMTYDAMGQEVPFHLNGAIAILGAVLVSVLLRATGDEAPPRLPRE